MTPLQTALIEKATRALEAARRALDAEDAETAANRAYHTCFHAARAALAVVAGCDAVVTHNVCAFGGADRFGLRAADFLKSIGEPS
jgi:hypothetical protein